MVSRVSYRPFDEDDLKPIASIVSETWHKDAPSPEFSRLEGAIDLAHMLSISTFSQVALIDGAPSGIVLARSTRRRTPVSMRWQKVEEAYYLQREESDPDATARYGKTASAMDRVNDDLLRRSGFSGSGEVTLLVVGSSARGLGIGSVLLDAAVEYLGSQGSDRAFLYTDSDCSWPFYERCGLKRAGEHRAARDERQWLPKSMFLYALDLTA